MPIYFFWLSMLKAMTPSKRSSASIDVDTDYENMPV